MSSAPPNVEELRIEYLSDLKKMDISLDTALDMIATTLASLTLARMENTGLQKEAIHTKHMLALISGKNALLRPLMDSYLKDAAARGDPIALALKAHKKTKAAQAAEAGHSENRDMKSQALAWFKENKGKFSSKDEAATAILDLVPVSFSTARKWLRNQ